MFNDKIEDLLQLSKVSEMINTKKNDEKLVKTVKIVLICIGALTVLLGAGYLVYRLLNRCDDEYDLYDDLDNYYDDDLEEEASEEDFAE